MDPIDWVGHLVMINTAMLIVVVAIGIFVLITVQRHLFWVKDYLKLTKSYTDLIETGRSEVSAKVTEEIHRNANLTQEKLETKVGELKEEVRKAAEDIKQTHRETNGHGTNKV